MQDEGRIQGRLGPALTFVSQEVKIPVPPDGTADIAAELVETECIESRCREQIVRVELVIAEELVGRAVNVVTARFGNRVYDSAEIAPIVGGIRTIGDAEFSHPILRRADALHAGNAGGVVGAVEAEECAVSLAQPAETQLQDRFLKRRLRSHGGAPAYVHGGREQHEINEVPAGNWQVGDLLRFNDLADFRFLRIHSLSIVYFWSSCCCFCFSLCCTRKHNSTAHPPTQLFES